MSPQTFLHIVKGLKVNFRQPDTQTHCLYLFSQTNSCNENQSITRGGGTAAILKMRQCIMK